VIESLVLIEGQDADADKLRSLSLGNAKQVVIGKVIGFGTVLHIAATSSDYLNDALQKFAGVSGVTGIVTLAIRLP
jgi:hypothetical protein